MSADEREALPAQPNQSLIRGLEVFQTVVAAGKPVGSREVARLTQLEPTAVNRYLKTLAYIGLLQRDPQRKYQPGSAVNVLSALSLQGSPLLRAALPRVRSYWEDGFALTLGVLWQQHLCYLLHARPELPFEESVAGHQVAAAPESSAGMVLLAAQPNSLVARWKFEQPPRVVEPIEKLKQQLAEVQKQGFATRNYTDGTVSVGVPIHSPPIAALAVSKRRLTAAQLPKLIERLRTTASEISNAAGDAMSEAP
jgi:DNA-binding IclR family transcriptional regulator